MISSHIGRIFLILNTRVLTRLKFSLILHVFVKSRNMSLCENKIECANTILTAFIFTKKFNDLFQTYFFIIFTKSHLYQNVKWKLLAIHALSRR
jgi:hypothetical protein